MADELKALGNKAFLAKDYENAIKYFSEAIELTPDNHVFYSNRSACFASLKQYEKALEDAEKTIELKKDWAKGYGRKGAALHGLNKTEEARQAYKEGLAIEPNNAQLKKGLEEAEFAMYNSDDSPIAGLKEFFKDDIWQKIATNPKLSPYLAQPDFVQKIQEIQKNPNLMSEYMQDQRILSVLMSVLGAEVKTKEEMDAMQVDSEDQPPMYQSEPTPKAEPSKPTPKSEPVPETPKELTEEEKQKEEAVKEKDLGNQRYKKREFDAALEHYAKAWELDPTNITILTNQAAVQFEMGNFEACIKTCEEAVEVGRELRADFKLIAKAFGRIGNAYFKLNQLDEAIKYYNKSLTEHRTPDILNKLREAEKLKEKEIKDAYYSPELSDKAREAGNELFKKSNFAEAVKQFTEAIKRNDKDPRAYSNRAACYTKLMAFHEALKDCESCITIDPSFVKGYIRKAAIEFLKREYTKCIETCETAKTHDKDGKHRNEIEQQMTRCYMAMQGGGSGENESREETLKRAANDPEVQQILADPVMNQILQQMQEDPKAAQDHMKNPAVASKIRKLIDAGIIRVA
ncbi:Hsp90 cochaperone [Basidiobolus ranarum]|uniref:Hsp90 cochaperone n=1 Tax=Basidiobolus ranarum TaxID=34480 RepID=A0ABR2W1N3_9FUNG